MYFLDTSALVKLYVSERGSDAMLDLAKQEAGMFVLSLSRIEFRSALRRRVRAKEITAKKASPLLQRFHEDLESYFRIQAILEEVLSRAERLIDAHFLRAYDAVQLAGCLVVREIDKANMIFACSDRVLLAAAKKEKLDVFNPEDGAPAG